MSRFDRRSALILLVLASWCALSWFLFFSGRTSIYLSNRTDWVIPMGGVILILATIGRLPTMWRGPGRPVTRSDMIGAGALLLPVVLIAATPPASLGSYAVGRRSNVVSSGFVTSAADVAVGELTLIDISGALRDDKAMAALTARAGEEVEFIGFITRDPAAAADEFTLNRFLVSCCVADALNAQVQIVGAPPGVFKVDEWVEVKGNLYPLGREIVVDATEVTSVPRPKDPYLSP
jgi:putative membrane protein